jgi:hypothetical protein
MVGDMRGLAAAVAGVLVVACAGQAGAVSVIDPLHSKVVSDWHGTVSGFDTEALFGWGKNNLDGRSYEASYVGIPLFPTFTATPNEWLFSGHVLGMMRVDGRPLGELFLHSGSIEQYFEGDGLAAGLISTEEYDFVGGGKTVHLTITNELDGIGGPGFIMSPEITSTVYTCGGVMHCSGSLLYTVADTVSGVVDVSESLELHPTSVYEALVAPEPATWAEMLLGLTALGLLARRRQRVV